MTAINIFLKQAVRENRIPFEISRNTPNASTLAAFAEGDRIAQDDSVKGYSDMASLRKALEV